MGMTIEESLEWVISRKEHYEMDDNCQELAQALDTAIDTMQKYQKIKEIYDNWNVDFGVETHRAMNKIGDIIKDGNDD